MSEHALQRGIATDCIDQKELQKSFWKPIKLSRKCGQKGEFAKANRDGIQNLDWTLPALSHEESHSKFLSPGLQYPHQQSSPTEYEWRDMSSNRKTISRRIFTLCISIQLMFTGTFNMSKEADIWRGMNMPCRHLFLRITSKGSTGIE